MLNVYFWNKNEEIFQIDLNSDFKEEPDLKSRLIVQNNYVHEISRTLCFHCRTLELSTIKTAAIAIPIHC